jgi:hypothetical protein
LYFPLPTCREGLGVGQKKKPCAPLAGLQEKRTKV